MTPDPMMLHVMRAMAWERAKGELKSILQAFVNDRERFERMDEIINNFIVVVEEESPIS